MRFVYLKVAKHIENILLFTLPWQSPQNDSSVPHLIPHDFHGWQLCIGVIELTCLKVFKFIKRNLEQIDPSLPQKTALFLVHHGFAEFFRFEFAGCHTTCHSIRSFADFDVVEIHSSNGFEEVANLDFFTSIRDSF